MSTIFYSWQSDRSANICRNLIGRALQAAIDRLRADIEIESSAREDLALDRDTKDVPGSPAIFDTILRKIASAGIFVPDLTFVGVRAGGRAISNPNVLIEYGYALHKPGAPRILAVMNDFYGKPSTQDLPFNMAHRRFPMTYTLPEGASEDDRKAVRKVLTDKFETALRAIITSEGFKAESESMRTPSALDVAALYKKDLEYQDALRELTYRDGPHRVIENVKTLFEAIKRRCETVAINYDFGIECDWELKPRERFQSCVLRASFVGVDVQWDQPRVDSLEAAMLGVREYKGNLYLPGEFQDGVHIRQPENIRSSFYMPTLSRDFELGWVDASATKQEPPFLSNEVLAEECVTRLVNLIRRFN